MMGFFRWYSRAGTTTQWRQSTVLIMSRPTGPQRATRLWQSRCRLVLFTWRSGKVLPDPAIVQIQLEETAPQHAQLVFDMTAPSAIATIEAARPKVDEDTCLLINSIAWEEFGSILWCTRRLEKDINGRAENAVQRTPLKHK